MQPKTRFQIPDLVNHGGRIIGVEVGTDQGAYASELLKAYPELLLVTVDPWQPYPEIVTTEGEMDDRTLARKQYAINMRPHAKRFIHLELDSVTAALRLMNKPKYSYIDPDFRPPYDFVFIDAAHHYGAVKVDLVEWWDLIRVGGVLSGHDFDVPDVSRAVVEFAKAHRCDLQIINEHGGRDEADSDSGGKKPGTGVDHIGGWARPSWYWFKESEDQ